MASDPIRIALIGLGRSGWKLHLQTVKDDDRYQIVSVFDPAADRRKEAEQETGCDSYDDLDAMLEQSDAELVVVASPSHLHADQTVAAVETGHHVVTEKPMAASLTDADRMIAAAEAADRELMVHQNYRFRPHAHFLRRALDSGRLGELFHIGFRSHNYDRRNDWQCLQKYGGGLLPNHVVHHFDLALALLDEKIDRVFADLRHVSDAGDCEDHAKLVTRTQGGRTIDVEISTSAATTTSGPQWTLLGTTGALTIERGQVVMKWFDPDEVDPIEIDPNPIAADRRYGNDDELPWQTEEDKISAETEACQGPAFYDAVWETLREDKPFPVRGDQVREVMRVLDEARNQSPVNV
ncbi:MAG: Gfo/Idh/MocA family oxidoreductase [Phycisphaeraceae bacterium]|nr:Gfo/Idh/MocA family oxidoreductase [Phycisphaeraceae bacterium]